MAWRAADFERLLGAIERGHVLTDLVAFHRVTPVSTMKQAIKCLRARQQDDECDNVQRRGGAPPRSRQLT